MGMIILLAIIYVPALLLSMSLFTALFGMAVGLILDSFSDKIRLYIEECWDVIIVIYCILAVLWITLMNVCWYALVIRVASGV